MIFMFIWGVKIDKIKRTKAVQQYSKDGLYMVNIEQFINSMKFSWLKRLYPSTADWNVVAAQDLPSAYNLLTYGSAQLKCLQRKTTNQFYVNVLETRAKFNKVEEIVSGRIYCYWTKFETTVIEP